MSIEKTKETKYLVFGPTIGEFEALLTEHILFLSRGRRSWDCCQGGC